LATASLEKSRLRVKAIRRKRESPIPVPEKPSAFHPHALTVVAMRVCNPDRSPLRING
jgi:hypothetical protein